MSRTLSADDFLHGAMYAMEQAGLLLHDAVGMYERGRYSSAVALGVFAREEIGRAEIFLGKWKEVLASGSVSADAVIKACDDHVKKLGRGQAGITLRLGPEHSEKVKGLFGADREGADYKKARAFVDEWVKRKARRDPDDTHQKRIRALYVEPTDSGWNRPCETSKEDARQLLEDVANDYGVASRQPPNTGRRTGQGVHRVEGVPEIARPDLATHAIWVSVGGLRGSRTGSLRFVSPKAPTSAWRRSRCHGRQGDGRLGTFLALAVFAGSAAAGAWVAWRMGWNVRETTGPGPATYTLLNGTKTYQERDATAAKAAANFTSSKGSAGVKKTDEGCFVVFKFPQLREESQFLFKCVPDTIDPRAPKGGGR